MRFTEHRHQRSTWLEISSSFLAIDAPVVVGEGAPVFDPRKKEYGGILQLEVTETIAVKAIGLLTTRKPDASKG